MKNISFRSVFIIVIAPLLFVGMFFGNVANGDAQSSQVWSDPVNLSNSGASLDPIMVVDTRGTIHVIWVDRFDGYKYVESADGIKWTSPITVVYPFSPKDDGHPVFVSNVNGGIQIFWRDKNSTLFYAQAQPETLGIPGSWTGTLKLADSVMAFDVKTDSRGGLHVAYVKSSSATDLSPAGIYYRKLDGAGWSSIKNLYASPYFRSLNPDSAHVRLSVTDNEDSSKTVYVVWDDRLQKRIFLAKTAGQNNVWDEPVQLKGPEDFTGSDLPFNVNVSVVGNNVLLLWEAGEPGSRCTQYSQWSVDGGKQFAEPIKMLDEFVSCPKESNFISQSPEFSVVLLNIQDDLSLIAWNGSRWSALQPQADLSVFLNPVTFDNVLFGCQNTGFNKEVIFVVGCDQGTGGDIWFRSRPLGSLDEWFPPSSAWTLPVEVTSVSQKISSLVSVVDNQQNVIHTFWVQAPLIDIDKADTTIQYARWSKGKWSKPVSILAGFDGIPSQLSSTLDTQGKVFLSWNEGKNSNLYFSWASVERANVASEWSDPQQLPTPTQISSSPDILVDGMDKIIVAYSVPLNEDRGIYVVQSDDFGKTWLPPVRVFDAIAANWDLADQPKIALSGDGRLHLLFSKASLRESDPSGGLYYVISSDGGGTWSQPTSVTEIPVLWSQIVSYDKQVIHRMWQENTGLTLDVFHQVSTDGGENWESSVKVFSTNDLSAKIALSKDIDGHLYISQTHGENTGFTVDVSQWNGTRWVSLEKKEISVKGDSAQYSTVTGITSDGTLSVITFVNHSKLISGLENKIITFTQSVELSGKNLVQLPLFIATPAPVADTSPPSSIQSTPTISSPLANLADSPSASRKNLVGLMLVGMVVILIIIVIWPRKKTGVG